MILTVQVYDAFLKYIEKRTTSSIWQEVNEAGITLDAVEAGQAEVAALGRAEEHLQNIINGC